MRAHSHLRVVAPDDAPALSPIAENMAVVAERDWRDACDAFLRACFRGAPPDVMQDLAIILYVARDRHESLMLEGQTQ